MWRGALGHFSPFFFFQVPVSRVFMPKHTYLQMTIIVLLSAQCELPLRVPACLCLLSSAEHSWNIFVFYKARMCLQVLRGDFWIPFKSFPVRVGAKIPITQQPHPRGSLGDNNFKNRVTDAWLERVRATEREKERRVVPFFWVNIFNPSAGLW